MYVRVSDGRMAYGQMLMASAMRAAATARTRGGRRTTGLRKGAFPPLSLYWHTVRARMRFRYFVARSCVLFMFYHSMCLVHVLSCHVIFQIVVLSSTKEWSVAASPQSSLHSSALNQHRRAQVLAR